MLLPQTDTLVCAVRALTLYALVALAAAAAVAQTVASDNESGNPPNWCRNGAFTADATEFKLAQVAGAPGARVYFHGDGADDCPQAGANCRQKSYVVAGDQLVVSRRYDAYLCGWYQPQRGHETVGWLPAASLRVVEPDKQPPVERWLGAWQFYGQTLRVSRAPQQPGQLHVEGEAFWRGLGDNIHTGEVAADARPAGHTLALDAEECQVTLRLVGDYLIVRDNLGCGGVNVTFNGVYQRAPARRRAGR
jgi:hypothetical protein